MSNFSRRLTMAALGMSGGIIFMLPFLRENYYLPIQTAFGYSNTQMGTIMSLFGAMSMIGYFPGGWLADKFSSRHMMTGALAATGLVGLYYSTLPNSYTIILVIHAFWGLTITLSFWSAMIKATRNWAREGEQGRAFGFLEGGRGFTEAASGTIFGMIFVAIGSNNFALSQVIILFSVSNLALAALVWFSLKDEEDKQADADKSKKKKVGLADIKAVITLPEVWLITIVIMASYSGYWGAYYFAPYATSAFSVSVGMGVMIGVGKVWLNPIVAPASGFISDKIGISRAVFGLLVLLVCTYFIFGILPHSPAMFIFMIINVVITAVGVFALRGIYFALLDEGGIPAHLTGTAAGIVSALGFLPDVYMPYIGGVVLDAYPEAIGYKYLYLIISGMCFIGAGAAYFIMKRSNARRASNVAIKAGD